MDAARTRGRTSGSEATTQTQGKRKRRNNQRGSIPGHIPRFLRAPPLFSAYIRPPPLIRLPRQLLARPPTASTPIGRPSSSANARDMGMLYRGMERENLQRGRTVHRQEVRKWLRRRFVREARCGLAWAAPPTPRRVLSSSLVARSSPLPRGPMLAIRPRRSAAGLAEGNSQ
jgi:hypothetical protein